MIDPGILETARPKAAETLSKLDQVKIAVDFYPMPHSDRVTLRQAIAQGITSSDRVNQIVRSAEVAVTRKLEFIGLTPEEYLTAYRALADDDLDSLAQNLSTLSHLKALSSSRIDKRRAHPAIPPTIELFQVQDSSGKLLFTPKRQILHQQIVAQALSGIEQHRQGEVAQIMILIGLPGAGKSSARELFIQKYASSCGGYVATDPDRIRHFLLDGYDESNADQVDATKAESYYLADLIYEEALKKRMNILYEGTGGNHQRLLNALMETRAEDYEVSLQLVHADPAECLRRSVALRQRAVDLPFLLDRSRTTYDTFAKIYQSNDICETGVFDNSPIDPGKTGVSYFRSGRHEDQPEAVAKMLASVDRFKNLN